jgi:predicted AlkP superfamily pyrophosphatase or phosphodiesterase
MAIITALTAIARHSLIGFAVGLFATAAVLFFLPHFYSRFYELAILPIAVAVVAALIDALWRLLRALLRRPLATSHPLAGRRLTAALLLGIVLVMGGFIARAPTRAWKVSPELIVLCVDGGTWDVADPLIAAGRMPTVARLKREGTSAVLMSTDPSFSMVVWTTIGTGVSSENHGIQTFYDTADHLRAKRIWEIYEESGHSVGLFRWFVTWPPSVKNGFVIPDILARDGSSFPPRYAFVNQLRMSMKSGHTMTTRAMLKYGVQFLRAGLKLETCLAIAREVIPARRAGATSDAHIAARRAEIRLNADVYGHLLRETEPEFTCFYDNGVDQMSHFYWQYHEPAKFTAVDPAEQERYRSVISDYYVLNDRVMGEILEHVDTSSTVVVLSDHGFAAETTGAHAWFFPRGVTIVADMDMEVEYFAIAMSSRTFVYSVHRDPQTQRRALEDALARFNALTVQESGTPLFRAWIDEDSYVQLDVSDSLRTLDGHVQTPRGLVPLRSWFDKREFAGTHHPRGMIVVRGGAFRRGRSGQTASLVDIAPTVLYSTGFPLSRELEGTVMWDWIAEGFREGHDVAWVDSYGHPDTLLRDITVDEETLKKLRSLGYVR